MRLIQPHLLYPALALFQTTVGYQAKTTLDHRAEATTLLYQFPNGTWIENIAVRSNNHLLLTLLTTPDLYALDTTKPGADPTLVHSFAGVTALFGIAELDPDVFAVAAGNFSLDGGVVPGSFGIHRVSFSQGSSASDSPAAVELIAEVPEAEFINGLCSLPNDEGGILLGDIAAGQVLRLDTLTGETSVVVPSSNELAAVANNPTFGSVGVDGLHVHQDDLYVANAGNGLFGRIPISSNGVPQRGAEPTILARAANGTYWDDFAIASNGDSYLVTGSGNSVVKVDRQGRKSLVAGNKDSAQIEQPTSAALSRGRIPEQRLYVVTAGGLASESNGLPIQGGQVLAIDL